VRKRDPALVTALMTGWVLEEDDTRLSSFDLRLKKPVRTSDLVAAVAKAIELHDSRG
jgi:hypothetical protein